MSSYAPAESAAERRIVSVLFADLVGYTSLSEKLGAEDVATVQAAYFAAVRETVARYQGRVDKFIGDAAMAVFGIPRARDDDAERAVRAALALTSAVEQLGARLGLDEPPLRLHVGVNTGDVIIGAAGRELQVPDDLPTLLDGADRGSVVPLEVLRAGTRRTIDVTAREESPEARAA
jgi:class 3 adenylate cyclase